MTDGVIQVPVDSTGKKIDTSEITRTDSAATVVERQRMVIGDDSSPAAMAEVRDQKLQTEDAQLGVLNSIDEKLGRIVFLLEAALT
jgi:hypothetical protein